MPCDWLTASVVMVFIPTDGHGYCGNSSRISIGSITGKNMLNTPGASLHHHFSLTPSDIWRWEVWALTSIKSRFLKALNLEKKKKKKKLSARPKNTKTPGKKKTIYVTKVLKHKQIQCFWLLFAFCSLRDHQGQYSGYKLLTRPRMTVPSVSKQTRDLSHAHQHKWPSASLPIKYTCINILRLARIKEHTQSFFQQIFFIYCWYYLTSMSQQ